MSSHPRARRFGRPLKHILRRNGPVCEPGIGFPHRNHVWHPVTIPRFVVRVDCSPSRSNHGAGRWDTLVTVGSQSNFFCEDKILNRSPIFQYLFPGRKAILLDFAKILGPEQDPGISLNRGAPVDTAQLRTLYMSLSSSFAQVHRLA
jgi:hypothetical protein